MSWDKLESSIMAGTILCNKRFYNGADQTAQMSRLFCRLLCEICSSKGILWKQRLHQRTETRECIFLGPD